MLRTRLPRWTALPGVALAAGGIAFGIWSSNRQQEQQEQTPTPSEQQPAAEAEAASVS